MCLCSCTPPLFVFSSQLWWKMKVFLYPTICSTKGSSLQRYHCIEIHVKTDYRSLGQKLVRSDQSMSQLGVNITSSYTRSIHTYEHIKWSSDTFSSVVHTIKKVVWRGKKAALLPVNLKLLPSPVLKATPRSSYCKGSITTFCSCAGTSLENFCMYFSSMSAHGNATNFCKSWINLVYCKTTRLH